MEKNGSPRDEEEGFLPPWEKLRGFARGWAFRLLGINPEAEEVGEEAYHELLVSWVKGRFPAHPFGWLKRVVVRMASKNGHAFHSKMFRAGGEESFLENIPAPDPMDSDGKVLDWMIVNASGSGSLNIPVNYKVNDEVIVMVCYHNKSGDHYAGFYGKTYSYPKQLPPPK